MFYYVDEVILSDIKEVILRERRLLDELKNEVLYLKNTDMNEESSSLYNQVVNKINNEIHAINEILQSWDLVFDNHNNLVRKMNYSLDQIDISQRSIEFFD